MPAITTNYSPTLRPSPQAPAGAHFACVLVLCPGGRRPAADHRRRQLPRRNPDGALGAGGFSDPCSGSPDFDQSMAELEPAAKNRIFPLGGPWRSLVERLARQADGPRHSHRRGAPAGGRGAPRISRLAAALALYPHSRCVQKCPIAISTPMKPAEKSLRPPISTCPHCRRSDRPALGLGRPVVSVFSAAAPQPPIPAGLDRLLAALRALLLLQPDAESPWRPTRDGGGRRFAGFAAPGSIAYPWASRAFSDTHLQAWAASTAAPRRGPRRNSPPATFPPSIWI